MLEISSAEEFEGGVKLVLELELELSKQILGSHCTKYC